MTPTPSVNAANLIAGASLHLSMLGHGTTTWNLSKVGPESQLAPAEVIGITSPTAGLVPPSPGGWVYQRTERPGQGHLSVGPTQSLMIVLIDTIDGTPEASQALRYWGDFLHIPRIASSGGQGLTMVTPFEVNGEGPRYLHLYEFDRPDVDDCMRDIRRKIGAQLNAEELDIFSQHPQRKMVYSATYTFGSTL